MERVPGALLGLDAGVVAELTEQRWGERRSSRPGRGCVGAMGGERIPWRADRELATRRHRIQAPRLPPVWVKSGCARFGHLLRNKKSPQQAAGYWWSQIRTG